MSEKFDELVAVMARLRAPGGCPWDREQTYGSLAQYLLEQEIAKHKLPERMETIAEFPLSPFGKVSKKDLTERITRLVQANAAADHNR